MSTIPASKPKEGISVKTVLLPTTMIVLLLHAVIVLNTLRINKIGQDISSTTQVMFSYSQLAKEVERATDTLSDDARLFISTGEISFLDRYFAESAQIAGMEQSLSQLMTDTDDGGAYAAIDNALRVSQDRAALEYHAMRLSADAAQVDLSAYPLIAETALTPEEEALTPAEKQTQAMQLLNGTQYMINRTRIHDYIDTAVSIMSSQTARQIGVQQAQMGRFRTLQWGVTLGIIALLTGLAIVIFRNLVLPLKRSVDEVQRGDELPTDRGFYELRHLAQSYDELLYHRRMLENDLRRQSQTDALTGLPNRLAFENYITRIDWQGGHSPVTVFSLDVNGLKEKNDTQGHVFGDTLLQDAAACILEAFGDADGKNCFRFGGDEFAAFWIGRPEADIAGALERFEQAQQEKNLSVSVGYAFAPDLSKTTVETLFELADKSMYRQKTKVKRYQAPNQPETT